MQIDGLYDMIQKKFPEKSEEEKLFLMEFTLHGLAEYSMLSKKQLVSGTQFKDLLSGMFSMPNFGDEEDED